jgi:hypothetical protein
MEFINYFDIPREDLEETSMMRFLERLYKRIGAPKGRIRAWYSLPHEDKGFKRICVFYTTDEIQEKQAAR